MTNDSTTTNLVGLLHISNDTKFYITKEDYHNIKSYL